jgi:HIV Tat-specific factor 1
MALRNPDDDATAVATSSLERANFPQDPAEFDSDPRISFSKLDNTFILETDDGQEFEFDNTLKRWIPTVSVALLRIRPHSRPFLLRSIRAGFGGSFC